MKLFHDFYGIKIKKYLAQITYNFKTKRVFLYQKVYNLMVVTLRLTWI